MSAAAPRGKGLPEWEQHHTVFVAPENRGLVTIGGTLRADPRYWSSSEDKSATGTDRQRQWAVVFASVEPEREALAKWLASCGLSAKEIADHFVFESLGRRRRAVTPETVRRWAGQELRQYKILRKSVLDSHPLVAEVRRMRSAELPRIIRAVLDLRDEYRRDKSLVRWIALEECMRQIARRVHVKPCAYCDKPFLSKRRNSQYCPGARCRKAGSRSNVTDNRVQVNANSIGREEMLQLSEIGQLLDRQQRSLDRIEQIVAVFADPDRIPSAVFSQAIDAFRKCRPRRRTRKWVVVGAM
jgi:hypothetical protein